MSFQIKALATVRISSENVTKSKEWYSHFFERKPIEDTENFVSFKLKNISFDICMADPRSPVSNGGSVVYWLVDNLDEAIKKAVNLGGTVYRGPLRIDEVQRTIAQIKDPYGNVFGLEAELL